MAAARSLAELPWSERYRPKHLGQVVGNTDQVRKLAEWLRDWDDVVLHGKVKEVKEDPAEAWRTWKKAPENINAKAVLISGPPGIGKTTTVGLVAKCNPRYSLREFNASDVRNKKAIEQLTQSLSGNHTLKLGAMFGKGALERPVLIMDECDGMDDAGTKALVAMIKNTKSPIICICNDRQAQSVRSLSECCLDIKFRRPENVLVAKRIRNILEGEGKKVELSSLESIVEACAQDIRQVINQVQFFGVAGSHARGNQKDAQLMLSPFDACQKLLTKPSKGDKPLEMGAKMDMYYIDADMMPLMIQENYLKPNEKGSSSSSYDDEQLANAAYAAELIATGDSLQGDWGVQSSTAILGTVYPAFLTSRPDFSRPNFPSWLQKRGGITKANRVSHDLHARLRVKTTCSHRDLVTSGYHDVLYRRFLPSLASGDVKKCAALLHSCGLDRDFFTEQAPVLRKPLQLDDKYFQVDGRVRQQLLSEMRLLQEAHNPVKRKIEAASGPAAKKAKKAAGPIINVSSWVKKKQVMNADGVEEDAPDAKPKEPMIILKYIEGHTIAVRRKIHLQNLLVPWKDF